MFRKALLAAATILLTLTGQGASTATTECGPRVRKAWRMMSSLERQTYKDAIASALDKGEFFEFTKIHLQTMSERQAHQTCAFLIWHKRFLLAFENMLRAQSPASACLTVPYWDTMTEYAQMVDGKCTNIYDCGEIVRDLGGNQGTKEQSITINGRTVDGYCYPGWTNYCDDNKVCGCIPRGDLKSTPIPSGTGFQGLFNSIAFSSDFETYSKAIQMGLHNDVHNSISGFMGTFSSPNDPIFWSWHATIDMLLYIYHQCHLADAMTASEMKKSVYAFSQDGECRYSNDAPTAVVNGKLVQKATLGGKDYEADKNPVIGKYFKGISDQIGDLLGFRTLGEHSYSYQIPDAFKKHLLLKKELCPAFVSAIDDDSDGKGDDGGIVGTVGPDPGTSTGTTQPTTPTPTTVTPAPTTPTPTSAAPGPSNGKGSNENDDSEAGGESSSGGKPTDAPQETQQPTTKPDSTPKPDHGESSKATDPKVDPDLCHVNEDDASIQAPKYWEWVDAAKEKLETVFPGNHSEVGNQLQYLECMCFHEQFGIKNYTAEFVKEFKLPEQAAKPTCMKKVDEVVSGEKEIVIEVESFEADKVDIKPGVTPAPPVTEAPAPGEQVETDSQYQSAKTAESSATSYVWTSSLVGIAFTFIGSLVVG